MPVHPADSGKTPLTEAPTGSPTRQLHGLDPHPRDV